MNPDKPHILHDFDTAIQSLRAEVLTMAMLARQNVERALRGLYARDIDLCRAVIADDNEVDDLERKVDQHGMELLVRFHPVASDLRLVLAAMKMSTNLERISDHAVNIAKRARKICVRPELAESKLIEPLHGIADELLRDSVAAFTDRDSTLGASLKDRDKELDRMHKRLIASLSARLEEANGRAEDFLHLIFIARSLERIGDLAVNIGEEAVFLDSAKDIRHEKRLHQTQAQPPSEEAAG